MKHTTRSLLAIVLLLAMLCSALYSCGASQSEKPGGAPDGDPQLPRPEAPLTLTYTVEEGKNVLTVTSDEDSTLSYEFWNQKGNTVVGDAVAPSAIQVLRIGEGIAVVESVTGLSGMETVDIVDGEGLILGGYSFMESISLKTILIGGKAPTLFYEFLRIPQDHTVVVEYKEGATPYKTKYTYGGLPVVFESTAAIPDMSLEEYALATVQEAKLLAPKIAALFEKGQKDFLYMPYSNEIGEWAEIKKFALDLTKDATTEQEKVDLIYDYIVANIVYSDDAEAYEPYKVLTEKQAVCAGYVGLMHDMLSALGIASFYMNGYTLGTPGLTVENAITAQGEIEEGHAVLSVVWQDGTVAFYDPTWGVASPDANKNMTEEALAARMVVTEVETLEVMVEGVDFTLYRGSAIQFLADDGYIYNAEQGEFMINLAGAGDVRNYWLSQRIWISTDDTNRYASGSYQPAGTVMNGGLFLEGDNPMFSLASGIQVAVEKAFGFVELECETYGKTFTVDDGQRVFGEDGVIYVGDDRLSVAGYYGLDGALTIPATVRGKKVWGVNFSALQFTNALRSITLAEGIEHLYEWSLDNCFNLEHISLPSTLIPGSPNGPETWPMTFRHLTSLKTIEVAEGNPYLTAVDGVLYNKDMSILMHYPAMREGESFTIPASVKEIGSNAFSHTQLTEIVFPEGLEKVGADAFAHSHIKEITVRADVVYGYSAFEYSWLEEVKIEEGVTRIENYWFNGCQSLQKINFPTTLTEIGSSAFMNCTALYKLELPEGLRTVERFAFSGAARLVELTLPSTLTEIGENAFACNLLYHVINNSALPLSCGSNAYGEVAAEAVKISKGNVPSDMRFTEDGFIFYVNEETVLLVGYVGEATDLVLPETFEGKTYVLAKGAFAGNAEWGWNTTADRFYSYAYASWHPTMGIRSVTIPKTITIIPEHAFTGWASLETVYFFGTEEEAAGVLVDYNRGGNREFRDAEKVFWGDKTA